MTESMSDLLKQAQKMQFELTRKQEEMKSVEVIGSSGAGLVCVVMNGCHNIIRIDLDKSILTEAKEVLEDLLAAAVNDAVEKVKKNNESAMSGLTESLKLLGGGKFPF
tara:strand:+ start:394 stop:717 length:324 start_codon:yes stop_codon:yes gene_type:complete